MLCEIVCEKLQFQPDSSEKKENNDVGGKKKQKWFGLHLIRVKRAKLKQALSPLTQTITSFPEHHCLTEEPTDGWP